MSDPAVQVVMKPISGLVPAAQNSRVHTEDQIDQIAASIKKFGWTIPVLVDEKNMIIAGHARVRAAKKAGIDTAPCIVALGWSDEKKEAYQITDNRLSELSDWDTTILEAQIKRLTAFKFDLSFLDMSGFNLNLDGFKPMLAPTMLGTSLVTDKQVGAVKAGLENQFTDAQEAAKAAYTITCPHCGEDFDVTL